MEMYPEWLMEKMFMMLEEAELLIRIIQTQSAWGATNIFPAENSLSVPPPSDS